MKKVRIHPALSSIFLLLTIMTCSNHLTNKIRFDISSLSKEGLLNGVSVAYEFCISNDLHQIDRVAAIDTNVFFHPESKGRINCHKGQILCISNTHQEGYKKVLKQLVSLEFIEVILPCNFE